MSVTWRSLDAIHFDAGGVPQLRAVPVQHIAMGPGIELPLLVSLFPTPAPTLMLAITFQRARKTFTVHFPDIPRIVASSTASGPRRLRNHLPARAHVLVCRSEGAVSGYTDCIQAEFRLAIRAADFAIAYFKGKVVEDFADLHVRVCESSLD
ncbi:hypothetical protein K466DRAFT_605617 [Polyporus arcularius HHB13444]|uniref:Uncharacterized protein n=1 Tax=Polyporus arcularius HHB13444 TaxID=1314778 RepID=A0A5C3P2Y0_9APHY|nr:hypothetical protein K466DRAFT_605617 [Polyporus arcularius HHB13444]